MPDPVSTHPPSDGPETSVVEVPREVRTPPAEDLPRPFGRYELRALLGRGGMGAVYLAHDPDLDRLVALKIPRSFGDDPAVWRGRFQAEARAAATVHHPNICPVFEVGEAESQPYLTMAYLEGETLAARLRRTGPMPIPEAIALVRTVARAMAEAHDRGIVHRDLKPANIMIDRRGQPVVMDFGLALRPSATDDLRLTLSGVAMGTPSYMPPEQAGGDHAAIGPPADVYALGVILYELVAGQLPFRGATFGKLLAQIERDPPPPPSSFNPAIDPALEVLIFTALEKDPDYRFATAAALANALDDYSKGDRAAGMTAPGDRPTQTYVNPAKPPTRRSRWPAVAAGVLGVVLLALLGGAIYVATDYGDLVVELSDPTAKVDVKVNGQEVILDPAGKPIRIRAGDDQKMVVTGPDFETTAESFDLKRGGKSVVRVTLKPRQGLTNQPVVPDQATPKPLPPPKPVDFPAQATRVEIPGWQILSDATKEEMQTWLDDRKQDGHSVTWLDAVQVGDKPVFVAVAALDDRNSDWIGFLDLTAGEINNSSLLQKRFASNDRLVSLSGYAQADDVAAVVLVHPAPLDAGGFGTIGIIPMSVARENVRRFGLDGFAARLIRPLPIGNGRLVCALYAQMTLSRQAQDNHGFDLSEAELTSQLEKYRRDGYHPVGVVSYPYQGARRFAVTYREDATKAPWEVHFDLTTAGLKAKAAELVAKDLTPASVTAYPWDGAVRYATVWVKEPPRAPAAP